MFWGWDDRDVINQWLSGNYNWIEFSIFQWWLPISESLYMICLMADIDCHKFNPKSFLISLSAFASVYHIIDPMDQMWIKWSGVGIFAPIVVIDAKWVDFSVSKVHLWQVCEDYATITIGFNWVKSGKSMNRIYILYVWINELNIHFVCDFKYVFDCIKSLFIPYIFQFKSQTFLNSCPLSDIKLIYRPNIPIPDLFETKIWEKCLKVCNLCYWISAQNARIADISIAIIETQIHKQFANSLP